MISQNILRPQASIRPTTRAYKRKVEETKSLENLQTIEQQSSGAGAFESPLSPTPLEPPPSKLARRRPPVNLFTADLDTLSYYDVLGVRSDTSKPAIKQIFNEMLAVFSPNLDDADEDEQLSDIESAAINRLSTISRTLKKAAHVLTNSRAKSVYDSIIENKYSILEWQLESLRPLIADVDNLASTVSVLNNDVAELKDIVSQTSLEELVSEEINRRRSRGKRLRNKTTNRIRVQWRVSLNDETNGGITEEYLLDYFKKYGEIIGSVMCSSRPGCAVLEFNTLQSVTDVILEEGQLKRFIVQDLSEAELLSRDGQNELEEQLVELNSIANDILELKDNLENNTGYNEDIEVVVMNN
ncbi:BJDP [Rachiplusia nu nucleopolyhedrovirus]|uniref:BJDP n=1 Tax=Rachiplusia nu nucleopolyhedrovirus TaxID=2605775 RepID=A0AAE6M6G8_9ABAC|nr:BJDP [Rachiplusia nu nucleopolyhedrovirus]QEI03592.1 BJDP [Rachiplusia nu nucleopolyhedrovirus]